MKKSFMTRVLAVSLSAAMAFSMSSASNLVTASAASTVNLKTTFKTLKVGQTYKLTLKKNTLNWKITKVTTTNKKICTVYGKTASSVMLKGKGVGRAKISVKVKTTKRKYPKNIKIMKCTANVKPADGSSTTDAFKVTSATANSNTEVSVLFNQAIDAAEMTNFTVSDGVTVSKAELSADKKSVLLTIAGAEYGKSYELTVNGIKVAGKDQAEQKVTFTTPSATEKYPTTLEAKDKILASDGHSQTLVTFTIKDANGNPITDKGVEVAFTTSLGKFAEQRVSIQNGVATVMYTSEALMETQTSAITATVVESTDNQELMGLTATSSITLTPNPDEFNLVPIITSATAPTADRVIAYFNDKVSASDFKTASGKLDHNKFTAAVYSGWDNGWDETANNWTGNNVVGILDVPGNDNALQLLVSRPLRDNTNISVTFENKTKTSSLASASNTVYTKLTDAHQPSVLGAKGDGLRTVTINFSEAVLPTDYCDSIDAAGNKDQNQTLFAADNIENYLIDGRPLSYWGVSVVKAPESETPDDTSSNIKKESSKNDATKTGAEKPGEIQVGSYKDGEDNRHVVTIKLSRERFLEPGTHSMTISNVGDWAAKTDRERNIVNTQTFDFEVENNDVIPTFEVEEQSPEQWLLKFNSDIEPVSDTLTTPNSQYADQASVLQLQELVGSSWVTISDSDAAGKNPIRVSQVDDTRNYVVEVRKDWTQVYNTSSTKQNYFNKQLRLHIDAGKIVNIANNKQNGTIDIPLDGTIMRTPDVVSPEIGEVTPAEDTSGNVLDSYNVKLSEPVKLSDGTNGAGGANGEGLTPSQIQSANSANTNNQGVPMPSAQFIRVDNGQTVEGVITSNVFVDAYDTTINVAPESALSAGKWRLVISSISDDYGNTASTVAHEIDVTQESVTTNFKIVWAAVSDQQAYAEDHIGVERGRYIFVKFSKPVTMTGNSVNAGVTGNYTVNGATLPTGTQIRANIVGYDDHDGVTDSVTIILPTGNVNAGWGATGDYTVDGRNAMLNVSRAITATTGENLSNGGLIRIPFQYGSATQDAGYNDRIPSLDARTDAVWGNDDSEKRANYNNLRDYYKDLKSALENDKYRRVILTAPLDLTNTDNNQSDAQKDAVAVFGRSHTLTIKRAVDFDLNGNTINGNVVVSTTDAVNRIKLHSSQGRATINGYPNNKENVATLTVNAGSAKEFLLDNVIVNAAGEGNALNINDTWKASFVNNGQIAGKIRITDTNGCGFKNENETDGFAANTTLVIDSTGDINLKGNLTALAGIEVNQAAKLSFGVDSKEENSPCDISNLKIVVKAPATRVIFTPVATVAEAQFTAEADNVRVQLPQTLAGQMTFSTDRGGKIVAVDKDNKEVTSDSKDAVRVESFTDGGIKVSGIQKALENLCVQTGVIGTDKVDSTVTVSCGAISGGSYKVYGDAGLIKTIEKANFEGKAENKSIVATYTLLSNNLMERSGDDFKLKEKWQDQKDDVSDTIRVTLAYDGYTMVKYIKVTRV